MKNILLVLFIVISINSFSQQMQSEGKLTKKDGKYKIEFRGKIFDANENILTVKPKGQVNLSKDMELVRKNKLGFIDIKIPKGKNIEEYANELKKSELFDVVDFNSFGEYTAFNPNDPMIANQWHLSKIKMYDAWGITTGSSCVVVAVLDSGIDWEHEDIGLGTDSYQNIFLNPGEDAWTNANNPSTGNRIDNDNNGFIDDWKGWNYANSTNDSRPTFYHGTFVSGIISAKTNNSRGIAGVSGGNHSTGVRLLSYCIGINAPDGSVIDDAIIDAVDMGARVINLSIGVTSTSAIESAIQYAINNGAVLVAAAGNESSSSVNYPASNSNVIAVGATTTSDTRASFSNYGTELDVVAPGVDIYSTTLDNDYTTDSGTSFSTPQVCGIAALLLSINGALSPSQVRNIIESTSQKVGGYSYTTTSGHSNGTWNNQMGYGMVDAYSAVKMAVGASVSGPSLICSSGSTFTINTPPVDSIVWTCGPHLVLSSGQNTSSGTFVATGSGVSWVTARLVTGCRSFTLPHKDVNAGAPVISGISGPTSTPNNQWATYHAVLETSLSAPTAYNWILNPLNGNSVYNYGSTCDIAFYNTGTYQLVVQAKNTCSGSGYGPYYVTGIYVYNSYRLSISPNPTTTEATIELVSTTTEKAAKETEWDLEVYDAMQSMKAKVEKIKNNKQTLNTSGWKEGVYIIRAIIDKDIITGKLVVKH